MRRTHKLPIAPPRINDSPIPVEVMLWLFFQSSAETISSAITENPISSPTFHCDGESAKIPNAAPGFSAWMMRKNPGMTVMQIGNNQQRNHRKPDQQSDLPLRRRIRKNTKRGSRVLGVDDAKKSRNDGDADRKQSAAQSQKTRSAVRPSIATENPQKYQTRLPGSRRG